MMTKTNSTTQAHGYFRKSKAYGLVCGIVLGLALLGAGNVSADEAQPAVETPTEAIAPSVNEPQPAVSSPETQSEAVTPTENQPAPLALVASPEVAPKAVESQTTATITTTTQNKVDGNKQGADAGRYSYEVKTTLTEPAKSGDYVEYQFENLPYRGLDGTALKTSDGTVIGNLKQMSSRNRRAEEIGTEAQRQAVELGAFSSVFRAIFNDKVTNLEKISYSFSLTNGNNVFTYGNKDWTLHSRILANGQEVAKKDSLVSAMPKENDVHSFPYESTSQASYKADGTVSGDRLNFNFQNDAEHSTKAGDTFTTAISKDSGIRFDTSKIKVGDNITMADVGSNNETVTVNKNGVILFNTTKYAFEVLSVSDTAITYKVLQDLPRTDARYGGTLAPFIITDEKAVDLKANVINAKTTGTMKHKNGDSYTFNRDSNIQISGVKANASAVVIKKSSVFVKYVSEDGKVLGNDTVLDKQRVGTTYKTAHKAFKGYRFVKLSDDSAPATGTSGSEDVTVIYVYAPITGSVTIHYVDEAGNTIAEDVLDTPSAMIGTAYDTSDYKPKTIEKDGLTYTLTDKVEGQEVGEVVEGDSHVTYVYHKVVTNWLEEGTDKVLKAQEDGAREKGTIEGYEYVETTTADNGDVTHYFKKTPAPQSEEPETPKPQTPKAESPQAPTPATPVQGASVATLPSTGDKSSSSLLASLLGLLTIGFVGFGLKKKKEDK